MKFLLIATIPALLVLTWMWLTTRVITRLRRELGEVESRLARRFYTLQGRVTEIDATVRELDFERLRKRGEIRFDASMKVAEAIAIHPKVREIFAAFGLSGAGCSGPGLNEDATIAEACRDASLDRHAVVEALLRFVDDPAAPIEARAASAKLHQIGKIG